MQVRLPPPLNVQYCRMALPREVTCKRHLFCSVWTKNAAAPRGMGCALGLIGLRLRLAVDQLERGLQARGGRQEQGQHVDQSVRLLVRSSALCLRTRCSVAGSNFRVCGFCACSAPLPGLTGACVLHQGVGCRLLLVDDRTQGAHRQELRSLSSEECLFVCAKKPRKSVNNSWCLPKV